MRVTTITCDLCDQKVDAVIAVQFADGEHPHSGSSMERTTDVCLKCAVQFRLQSGLEFDVARQRVAIPREVR